MDMGSTMDTLDDLYNSSNKVVALVERNTAPQNITLVDPIHVARSSRQDLRALVAEIEKADNYIKANACNKLQVITEQIKFLHKQAENILLEAKQNANLHHVACNFIKQPGHIYHLYQRKSGQLYFSILSPEEWGNSTPSQKYKGSFRLEHDRSWTPLAQLQAKDDDLEMFRNFLPVNVTTSSFLQHVSNTSI